MGVPLEMKLFCETALFNLKLIGVSSGLQQVPCEGSLEGERMLLPSWREPSSHPMFELASLLWHDIQCLKRF